MPFQSRRQQRYFEANRAKLEREGVDVGEWERSTDYSHLPERAMAKTHEVNLGRKGSFNVKKGALHRMLGVPEDETIPQSKLKSHPGDSPLLKRRKASAKGLEAMRQGD